MLIAVQFKELIDDDKSLIKQCCGDYVDSRDSRYEIYELINELSSDKDGISPDDYSVFFMQIWFPTWCRLLIEEHSKK